MKQKTASKFNTFVLTRYWWKKLGYTLPVIAWFESRTRIESRFLVTHTRLESSWEIWWLDSTRVTFFTEWLLTRVTINDSESFFKNLRVSDRQTQFVCIQRNDHLLVQ